MHSDEANYPQGTDKITRTTRNQVSVEESHPREKSVRNMVQEKGYLGFRDELCHGDQRLFSYSLLFPLTLPASSFWKVSALNIISFSWFTFLGL